MREKKVEKAKATEADSQGGQRRGHQGQGLIQTELQADRLNPPLLSPSKESIKNSHKKKKITMQNKCKLTLNIEEHYTVDIAERNREVNKVLNIVVISTTFAC